MKNIALISGGDSKEIVVSRKSAKQVYNWIDKEHFNVFHVEISKNEWIVLSDNKRIEIDKNDFSFNSKDGKIKFEIALIMIHGTPGENGLLQAYFDLVDVPYTTPGFFISALTFNKFITKLYLEKYNIQTPQSLYFKINDQPDLNHISEKISFPCFVKPNAGGSSFGISKVNEFKELKIAIDKAFEEDNEILIEEFIEGDEVTCGVIKTSANNYLLPPTEIVANNEFFDYEAKYEGVADEITPARIPEEMTKELQKISSKIYDILECKGIVRIDYIIKNNKPYFIEINTVPGMSKPSIVPQQTDAVGLSLKKIYTEILTDLLNKK